MITNRRQFLGQVLALSTLGYSLTEWSPDVIEDWADQLSRHRLIELETTTVQMHWPRLVGKNSRLNVHGRGPSNLVCRIKTDRGAVGWGMFLARKEDAPNVLSKLKGRTIAELFAPSMGVIRDEARPLDFALHDLAGIILDMPVYKMLGAKGSLATPSYSGMIYFDDLQPEDNPAGISKVLSNCEYDVNYGYRQLKVKIGRGSKWMEKHAGLKRDIEVTRQIAQKFPDIEILVDGNDGFTCETFIQYLEGTADIELFWIEEPFKETQPDYAKLRAWLNDHQRKTLLADGEYDPDHDFLVELINAGNLDVYLPDICGYGFTRWRRLIPLMRHLGATTSPHAWGSALKTNYIAHLAAGLGNVVTIEGVTCTSEKVDFSDFALKNGKINPPPTPGFGMTLKA